MIDPYIQQYGRRLYGLCRHLCANVLDADDLYQETWMKAVKNFARYDPAKPFDAHGYQNLCEYLPQCLETSAARADV